VDRQVNLGMEKPSRTLRQVGCNADRLTLGRCNVVIGKKCEDRQKQKAWAEEDHTL
jgi:hypothetical protein